VIRVLVVPYPGSLEVVGGHVTQMRETVEALGRAGVAAQIGSPERAMDGDADIVHCFGDPRPLLRLGRPRGRLVVSPIYLPRWFTLGPYFRRPGYQHVLATRLRHHASWVRRPGAWIRRYRDFQDMLRALAAVDLLVVNSDAEAALLRRDARGRLPEVRVAHSGVSREAFDGDAERGRELLGIDDEPFVLSVARIEPGKNSLGLALALRGLPYRLVLVGSVLPGNERYLAAVQDAAATLTHVPHLDHRLVRHAHAAAAAHALPSWYETTGLSTLEALATGTPVVASGGPCERDYFADCAAFCRPASVKSIRGAILRAVGDPKGNEREVAHRYTWDRTARELIDAYAA